MGFLLGAFHFLKFHLVTKNSTQFTISRLNVDILLLIDLIGCKSKPNIILLNIQEISGAITQFYDIRGLTPYTEYEFVVLGVNNVGRGEKSPPIMVTTGDPGNEYTMYISGIYHDILYK